MSAAGVSSYSSTPISSKENRSLLAEGSKKFTSRKVHEMVAKIFAVIGIMALGLTLYAAFGLIAAPVTIITVFSIASFVTVVSVGVVFAALFFRPSEKKEGEVLPNAQPDIASNAFQGVDEGEASDFLPAPVSVPPLSHSELLQMQWRDRPFTSEAFGHRAFFDHLGVCCNARDWTQKILEETSSMSISQIAKKWPELFFKGVLQKADVLERLHREVANASSFEQITADYPELFFEIGFLTKQTPGLNRLVQEYVCSHGELLLGQSSERTVRLIVTYRLMTPAFQKHIEEIQEAVQKENLFFLENKGKTQRGFERNFRPIEERHRFALKELNAEMQSLKMVEDLERRLSDKHAKIKELQGIANPDLMELERMEKSVTALTKEIQNREKQAKEIFQSYTQELARLKEWRAYRDFDVSQLQQQIREAAAALDRARKAPVQGLGSAISALSRHDKQTKRLAGLEQKLALKNRVDGYQINLEQGKLRLEELSQKTLQAEQTQLGLPTLRAQLIAEKRKIASLEADKLAYQDHLRLKGERKALLETIRSMPFSVQFFFHGSVGMRRELEAKQRDIDRRFFEFKGDSEGNLRRLLENEDRRHQDVLRSLVSNLEFSA